MKILISQLILNIFFYKTGNVIILRLWINDQQKTAMYFHACILCVIVNAHFVHRSWSWAGILKNDVGHYVNTRTIINKLRVVLWSAKIIYIFKKKESYYKSGIINRKTGLAELWSFQGFQQMLSSNIFHSNIHDSDYVTVWRLSEGEREGGWVVGGGDI